MKVSKKMGKELGKRPRVEMIKGMSVLKTLPEVRV